MKATRDAVSPVGLTVLYEPDPSIAAIADIVLVSGIGGHPVNTWLYTPPPPVPELPKTPRRTRSFRTRPSKLLVKQPSLRRSPSASHLHRPQKTQEKDQAAAELGKDGEREAKGVYWPLDLLPRSCPEARILTWGSGNVALRRRRGMREDVFSLADGLLREFTLLRKETGTARRPIIFVAHSLGGILVKEALRRSEAAHGPARSLLPSISAVLFLACPHHAAEIGSTAHTERHMASQYLDVLDRDYALRKSMGLTGDNRGKGLEGLETGRLAFERMWRNWNFAVRCFRDGRGEAVDFELQRAATSIGDERDRADSLDTEHLGTCKFPSSPDANYKALLSVLTHFLHREAQRRQKLNPKEKECLAAILCPNEDPPPPAYPRTCNWPHDLPAFNTWLHRSDNTNRVLWVQGPPGTGKTTLLRSLCARVKAQYGPAAAVISASAMGRDLDTVFYLPCRGKRGGPAAVYRGLLTGLSAHDPRLRRTLLSYFEKKRGRGCVTMFSDADVVTLFEEYIAHRVETTSKRTFVFVDASENCSPAYLSTLASHLTQLVQNSDFTICLVSDHPTLHAHLHSTPLDIFMSEHNTDDIARYVSLNLHTECSLETAHEVASRSGGVFLWAEIVINVLNAAIEEGAQRSLIEEIVAELPGDLYGLYAWIFGTLSSEEKADCLTLMQCVILSPEPIRLDDLAVVAQILRPWTPGDTPSAALNLKRSFRHRSFDSPHIFHRYLRSRSVGLLELVPGDREPLGHRRVRAVHRSVADFFLRGGGYACLAEREVGMSFEDTGHYVLLRACLEFLDQTDFKTLGYAPSPPFPSFPSPPSITPSNHRKPHQANITPPFLAYAAKNLVYHLLSPTQSRHSLPQLAFFHLLARDNMRLYTRWTALLNAVTPKEVLSASESAEELLVRFPAGKLGLERVLQALWRLSVSQPPPQVGVGAGSRVQTRNVQRIKEAGSEMGVEAKPVTPSTAGSGVSVWSPAAAWTPLTPMSVGKGLAAF